MSQVERRARHWAGTTHSALWLTGGGGGGRVQPACTEGGGSRPSEPLVRSDAIYITPLTDQKLPFSPLLSSSLSTRRSLSPACWPVRARALDTAQSSARSAAIRPTQSLLGARVSHACAAMLLANGTELASGGERERKREEHACRAPRRGGGAAAAASWHSLANADLRDTGDLRRRRRRR